ncbi:SAF domain-containing protein [Pelotomaculum propionicicum]|uniref:SAF domain-containing protein n=1 Tax=Pelotomaculum propionicicum TaxID=258475 RepID=UPI003B80BF27
MKNYKTFFIAAVFCAVMAALVGVYGYNTVAKMATVAVASKDIMADEIASDKNITIGKEPAGSLKEDSIRNMSDLKGMVAKGYIPAGTPLRKSMFMANAGAGVAARLGTLDGNLVAVAVPESTDTSVGGSLKRGDKVTVKSASRAGAKETLSPKAEVLDVPNKETGVTAVLLALTPAEAERIAQARATTQTVWCELLPVRS